MITQEWLDTYTKVLQEQIKKLRSFLQELALFDTEGNIVGIKRGVTLQQVSTFLAAVNKISDIYKERKKEISELSEKYEEHANFRKDLAKKIRDFRKEYDIELSDTLLSYLDSSEGE